MSNPTNAAPRTNRPFFRPVSLIAGLATGMLGLAGAGFLAARTNWHTEFTRLHPMIAPESRYQPTVDELLAMIRANSSPEKVLVIVGGNSVLYGVGQPAPVMWTRSLQEQLGPDYSVVNLALRGSRPTDGGAVIAEALRDEYPRLIYIANVPPLLTADAIGGDDYRFMLLDAYYKGYLLPWEPRDRSLSNPGRVAREDRIGAWLDARVRYRSAWNWWTFHIFSTVPSPLSVSILQSLAARGQFRDEETNIEAIPFSQRFAGASFEADMGITRAFTERFYDRIGDGWQMREAARTEFDTFAAEAFPTALRSRTLIVISRNSPYYTSRLAPELRERDEIAVTDSISGWERHGYEAVDSGTNFDPADFGDRTHLTASGGRKLAVNVAAKVREMSARLFSNTPAP
jgi:hypothetical protein